MILAVAVAGIFALATSAQAGSPKGGQWAETHQTVAGTTPDMLDRSVNPISPKASQWAEAHQTVVSAGQTVDLVHATRPTLSPKDPRFDGAWGEIAATEFQVAPLK